MKTFIYLPLIALIILTGCKSNSFTTQRYTKFGHASHKRSSHDIAKVKKAESVTEESKVETEAVKEKRTPVTVITAGVSTIKDAILKPDRKVYDISSRTVIEEPTTASYSEDETITEDAKTTFKAKKTVKEKSQKDEGFIESAFATALWIVLVVIFICLIVFLLAAVF